MRFDRTDLICHFSHTLCFSFFLVCGGVAAAAEPRDAAARAAAAAAAAADAAAAASAAVAAAVTYDECPKYFRMYLDQTLISYQYRIVTALWP